MLWSDFDHHRRIVVLQTVFVVNICLIPRAPHSNVIEAQGLCDYYYRSLELAQGDYSAASLITQQLLGPIALKEAVQSRLELAIQTVMLNIQRQLSIIDFYQTMELPYTSPAYSPLIVSNDATSPNPPRSANNSDFLVLGSRDWYFQAPATVAGNLSTYNWFSFLTLYFSKV
jgi:hypothetical protein